MRNLLLTAAVTITLICSGKCQLIQRDILFKTEDTLQLKLNIARPLNYDNPRPLIVFIHGGGWKTGHRSAYDRKILQASEMGYVAATISHRYTLSKDKNGEIIPTWPRAFYDVQDAIIYLKSNHKKYRIDTSMIATLGASSGAHLALLAALSSPKISRNNGVTSRIHAAVNISGPTEMFSAYEAPVVKPFLTDFIGGSPEEYPELYKKCSPIYYVSSNSPPILTIHGSIDDVVPVEQAYKLDSACKANQVMHKIEIYDGQKHILNGKAAENSWDQIYEFLGKLFNE